MKNPWCYNEFNRRKIGDTKMQMLVRGGKVLEETENVWCSKA